MPHLPLSTWDHHPQQLSPAPSTAHSAFPSTSIFVGGSFSQVLPRIRWKQAAWAGCPVPNLYATELTLMVYEVQSATEVWKNIHSSATSKAAIRSEMYGAHAFCSHGLPGVLHLSVDLLSLLGCPSTSLPRCRMLCLGAWTWRFSPCWDPQLLCAKVVLPIGGILLLPLGTEKACCVSELGLIKCW